MLLPTLATSDEGSILKFNCELMSGLFEIDPTDARKLVPKEYELGLNEKGRAVVRFYVSSNCQKATFNEKDILSKNFGYIQVSIDIQGPPEIP